MMDFYLDSKGNRYFVGAAFTHEDAQYSAVGATDETFAALGFRKVQVKPRPDDRFYVVSGQPLDDGSWNAQPRDLQQVKAFAVQRCKMDASSFLLPTDWMIVRQAETGDPVPDTVLAYRKAVRDTSNAYEEAVLAARDVEALAALRVIWPSMHADE